MCVDRTALALPHPHRVKAQLPWQGPRNTCPWQTEMSPVLSPRQLARTVTLH